MNLAEMRIDLVMVNFLERAGEWAQLTSPGSGCCRDPLRARIFFHVDKQRSVRTTNKFEIDEDGKTAYLEFETDTSGWMTIWHTEVPPALRGRGLATELSRAAFEHARANHLRVDVICPLALHFLSEHPEYKPLVGKKKE